MRMFRYSNLKEFLLFLGFVATIASPVFGRFLVGGKTFQEMFDRADFVTIATFVKTNDTAERKKLIEIDPSIKTTRPDLLQDELTGVETEFRIRATLKGPKNVKEFLLHHYKFTQNNSAPGYGDPNFVQFPTQGHPDFLMFLLKEKDGRYAPVTGQFDPALLSVLQLRAATSDEPIQ